MPLSQVCVSFFHNDNYFVRLVSVLYELIVPVLYDLILMLSKVLLKELKAK